MRWCLSILMLCVAMILDPSDPSESAKPQQAKQVVSMPDRLAGAWRLISVETTRPNGEVIYPFFTATIPRDCSFTIAAVG